MVALRNPRRPLSRACWAEKYEPLDRAAAFADSVRVVRSHLEPLRVLPERCLPADSSLPGHIPAQEARRAEEQNWAMSTPISAMIASAERRSTPGMVSSSSTWGSKG